jgi:hypothetical protein
MPPEPLKPDSSLPPPPPPQLPLDEAVANEASVIEKVERSGDAMAFHGSPTPIPPKEIKDDDGN